MDKSFNKIMPAMSDPLTAAVWGLAFLHAMNLCAIYYGTIKLFDLQEYSCSYVLIVLFFICLLCDHYYYIKLNNYRSVFSKYRKKKINVLGAIIYLVLSIVIAELAVFWAYDKI